MIRINLFQPGLRFYGFPHEWWDESSSYFPWEWDEILEKRHKLEIKRKLNDPIGEMERISAYDVHVYSRPRDEYRRKFNDEYRIKREQFFSLDPKSDFDVGCQPVAFVLGISLSRARYWRREWTKFGASSYKEISDDMGMLAGELVRELSGCQASKVEELQRHFGG